MRLPKLVTLIVIVFAFIAGVAAHSAMVSRGISLRNLFGRVDPTEKVGAAIMSPPNVRTVCYNLGVFCRISR